MRRNLEKVTVVKIGGSTLAEEDGYLKSLADLYQKGHSLIVVHGGGLEIDRGLKEQGIKPQKINGLRITDKATLSVVVGTLDSISQRLASKLESFGVRTYRAGPFSGVLEGEMLDEDLGYVGKVTAVKSGLINQRLLLREMPIISPIALSKDHPETFLNINADLAASAVALAGLGDIILLTNVAGVLDERGKLISDLTLEIFDRMYEDGVINSGMIPKIQAAFTVSSSGRRALICDSSNLPPAFDGNFVGTKISLWKKCGNL